ncbi:MAG: hypothetical protein GX154_02485 [Clostridiales bacterium]|nr:hypothetical protein [Clostridiales bacterium]
MQKKLIIGLALLIGIGIAVFAYTAINKQVEEATQTVQIVVLQTDVDAFSSISPKNITTKAVPPNIVDDFTVTSPEQITELFTSAPLYAGKPIDIRNIVDPKEDMQDKQVVGVFIDSARYAGVTEGDIVDIYRVDTTPGVSSPCVASNSRVLKIIDDKGFAVQKLAKGTVTEAGSPSMPHIVYLLINPSEVPFVVQGSVEQEKTHLALAKKSKESAPVLAVGAVE